MNYLIESVDVNRIHELCKKYKVSISVAKRVNFEPSPRLVKDFAIYDIRNQNDPLVREMEKLLKNNPTYTKMYWQDQGPCSNWGWKVWRPETKQEYEDALKRANEFIKEF